MDEIVEQARRGGARILAPPAEAEWGGYNAYFADPEGHLWEVAQAPTGNFAE